MFDSFVASFNQDDEHEKTFVRGGSNTGAVLGGNRGDVYKLTATAAPVAKPIEEAKVKLNEIICENDNVE